MKEFLLLPFILIVAAIFTTIFMLLAVGLFHARDTWVHGAIAGGLGMFLSLYVVGKARDL